MCVKIGSLTLREEHRLRVSVNRVLRRIFVPKREEVAGDWRRPYNDELHNLYAPPKIIKVIKLGRMTLAVQVTRICAMKSAHKILVDNRES
jgi:hypothetical protein